MAYIRRLPSGKWQATVRGPDGRRQSFADPLKGVVQQWADLKEKSQRRAVIRAEFLATEGDGIDPAGFYVYLLWQVQGDDTPVYVGASANILSRLGDHLGDSSKRPQVGWVTFIRCASRASMLRREGVLIRKYRPAWNKDIPLAEGGRERNGQAGAPAPASVPDSELQRLGRIVRRAGERARQAAPSPP